MESEPFVPNIRWLLALITLVHRFVYRVSGGRVGHQMGGKKFLLLYNVGRKSGAMRITPLLFVDDREAWIVVASNAGDDRSPAWWLNLQARPEAQIRVARETVDVRARQAHSDEAARLWPILEASYSYYPDYRGRSGREIPIVILERRGSRATED
jgi:deazaflavin-dependent oxidoreductase (nitroreductase family)